MMMKRTTTNTTYGIVTLHALIWGALMALPHLLSGNQPTPPGALPGNFWLISSVLHIGVFYLNAYVLYPRWLNKRFWWLYLLSIAAVVAAINFIKIGVLAAFFPQVNIGSTNQMMIFFPVIVFLVASIIYRLVVDKIRYEKEQKERQAEQLAMELKFLRSQISPHFLFNVLTNLVSLARKKSDLMEPSLIMLSDLMRYMLYDSEIKKVPLEKEIAYLKSYIELQKLRFGDDTRIETIIEVVAENRLTFTVRNKFSVNGSDSKDANSGIGLANVGTRLKLLYPDQHILSVQREADVFSTVLTLQLR